MEQFSPAFLAHIEFIQQRYPSLKKVAERFESAALGYIDDKTNEPVAGISAQKLLQLELKARDIHKAILQMRADRANALSFGLEQVAADNKFYMRLISYQRSFRYLIEKEIDALTSWDENYYARYEDIAMKLSKKLCERGL